MADLNISIGADRIAHIPKHTGFEKWPATLKLSDKSIRGIANENLLPEEISELVGASFELCHGVWRRKFQCGSPNCDNQRWGSDTKGFCKDCKIELGMMPKPPANVRQARPREERVGTLPPPMQRAATGNVVNPVFTPAMLQKIFAMVMDQMTWPGIKRHFSAKFEKMTYQEKIVFIHELNTIADEDDVDGKDKEKKTGVSIIDDTETHMTQ